MSTDDNNEWITVTKASKKRIFRHSSSRGGRRNKNNNNNNNNNNVPTRPPPTTSLAASSSLLLFDNNKNEFSVEEITKCLEQLILEEIPKSKFFQSFKSNIVDATANTNTNTNNTNTNTSCRGRSRSCIITKIICYGIGNFGKQSASQWQIACAIALWRILIQEQQQSTTTTKTETTNINNSSTDEKDITTTTTATITKSTTISMEYYDPCMTQNEIIYLERNGINVLSLNERGRKSVDNDNDNNEITLFFMPHCPLSLYTNVLYTNWECLHGVIIFGNVLSAYANRLLNQNKHVRLLRLLESHWIEVPMPIETSDIVHRSGNFEQAFNDSSVTYFKKVVGNAIDNKTDTPLPERPSFFEITTDSDEDEVI